MILAVLIGAVLLVMALTLLLNALTFTRLKTQLPPSDHVEKYVSILIPARNEARVIGDTVRRLKAQNYPHFEIIVLDDGSDDGTGQLAADAGATVITGQPLPPGWMGKNWACHQLSEAAQGDILIFTDADVKWEPDALSALLAYEADMVTVWPTQITETPAERLTVSLIMLVVLAYLPEVMVRFSPFVIFAAANGQCIAFKREAYNRIGGHAAVKNEIVEDVSLARLTKKHGGSLIMVMGNHQISCRMYTSWQEVRDGFAKNILAGHASSIPFLIFSMVLHWLLFILPPVWLIIALVMGDNIQTPLILWLAGLVIRGLSAGLANQRILDALLMPISVILMTRIAAQAIYWQVRFGGPRWKGRVITR
jgi:chlorobactene glucosyltransferase